MTREEAISDLNAIKKFFEQVRGAYPVSLEYAIGALKDKPKEGEWKAVKASIYPYGYDVKCSVCGFIMGSSYGFKYCPHCGAEMKGEESDE